jgi:hypothetical protein
MAGTARFIKTDEATQVYHRTFDNLPTHIKGREYYNTPLPSALEECGYYVDWTDPTTNQSGSIAVDSSTTRTFKKTVGTRYTNRKDRNRGTQTPVDESPTTTSTD